MTDLDARVAALMGKYYDMRDRHTAAVGRGHYMVADGAAEKRLEQAIRAELQKPALHEPVTNLEVTAAIIRYNNRSMREALESFLQGRAKSASRIPFAGYDPNFVPGSDPNNPQEEQPAQEEITDAERYQFASKRLILAGGRVFGWPIAPATKAEWDMYLDKAIRASKGEKT